MPEPKTAARRTWRTLWGLWPAASQPARKTGGRVQVRGYAASRPTRFNVGLGAAGDSSADAEMAQSLARMRAASRQMVRDASYAKRAKAVVVNNVIGPGVGMQAQVKTTRGELAKRVNDEIEEAWCEWSCPENCHTGGALHISDFERAAMGQVFEAGEVFIRKHYRRFGDSLVPLALELIEPERVPTYLQEPTPGLSSDAEVRMGIEVDEFGRPIAYWVRTRHPGDTASRFGNVGQYERVRAEDILHLRVITRWPQTRGEPWMHTALRKLDSIDQYSTSELNAAQADARLFGTIKSPPRADAPGALAANVVEQAAGASPEVALEDGSVQELMPGEELDLHTPTRPNVALDPFLRYMLREVAAGVGVSYESLSRDYSQTTYSSGRLAILDDRDLWRVLQQWWLRNFRLPLHRVWLQQAALAGVLATVPVEQYAPNRRKFEAVKFKPRGWSWVDPTKEVTAYKEAEKAGYISAEDVIAQTANGQDIEDVVDAIKRSRELYEEAGIRRDTDVQASAPPAAGGAAAPPEDDPAEPPDDGEDDAPTTTPKDPPRRVFPLAR